MIREGFSPCPSLVPEEETLIEPSFTVANLHKLCRIKVQWTANLKDHLKFDRSTTILYLFPHKICLISHLDSCNVLPRELVAETLKTLDLLFPFGREYPQIFGRDWPKLPSGGL